jgi:hypothetical protein
MWLIVSFVVTNIRNEKVKCWLGSIYIIFVHYWLSGANEISFQFFKQDYIVDNLEMGQC